MMRYAFLIAKRNRKILADLAAFRIPANSLGVDVPASIHGYAIPTDYLYDPVFICWNHFQPSGQYDEKASVQGAKELAGPRGLGLDLTNSVPPAFPSMHNAGQAMDLSISWPGDKTPKVSTVSTIAKCIFEYRRILEICAHVMRDFYMDFKTLFVSK